MEHIIEQLKILGLNEKQAKCYLALTELGQSTAYKIAEKAKLKRPITYVILDELRQKGLALKVPHPKRQIFVAKPPNELFAEHEEKLRHAKHVLPELLATAKSKNKKVKILYFEGAEGIRDVLDYGMQNLQNKEVVAFYGKGKTPHKPIPVVYQHYNKKLYDQGNKIRGFAPAHSSLSEFRALDKKYGWQVIHLDESEFSSEVSVEISDTFVRIMLYKDAQAVVVDNEDFAKMMKQIFEMVWKSKSTK